MIKYKSPFNGNKKKRKSLVKTDREVKLAEKEILEERQTIK